MKPLYFLVLMTNFFAYFLHFELIERPLNVEIKPCFVVEYVS